MLLGQADQTLQGTQPVDTAISEEAFGPGRRVRPDRAAAIQPILRAALHAAAFVRVDVGIGGGEAAALDPGVSGDHLLAVIEDADDA